MFFKFIPRLTRRVLVATSPACIFNYVFLAKIIKNLLLFPKIPHARVHAISCKVTNTVGFA